MFAQELSCSVEFRYYGRARKLACITEQWRVQMLEGEIGNRGYEDVEPVVAER